MVFKRILLSFVLLFGFGVGVNAETIQPFELENLSGERQVWPTELVASKTVVIVGFERSHQSDVEDWVNNLGLGSDGPYSQVLVLGRGATLVRGMIDGGLRKAFDANQQERTFTVYQSASAFASSLNITDKSVVTVLVLDRTGKVLVREHGSPNLSKVATVKATF